MTMPIDITQATAAPAAGSEGQLGLMAREGVHESMQVPEPAAYSPVQPSLPRDGVVGGLAYRELGPPSVLSPDVVCFWTISSAGRLARPLAYRIVPDGCIDIVFDVGDSGGAWAYGALDRPVVADLDGRVALFGIRFRPGRFGGALGPPAGSFAGRMLDASDVLGDRARSWHAELVATRDTEARISVSVARLTRTRRALGSSERIGVAVAEAIAGGEVSRVAELTERFGLSSRHLTRLCRHTAGLGPKRLFRVVRIQRALPALEAAPPGAIASVAAALGFADQAHLTNECRRLLGMTPGGVMRRRLVSDFCKTPRRSTR